MILYPCWCSMAVLSTTPGSIFTVHPLPCHTPLPSIPPSILLPLSPSPDCLSLLLHVSIAERDQGQLWLVLSVHGILWKQYITGNSCQTICIFSPSSLRPSCWYYASSAQLLHPVVMWVNVNLMARHLLCIYRGVSPWSQCIINDVQYLTYVFPKRILVFSLLHDIKWIWGPEPIDAAPFVDFLPGWCRKMLIQVT